MRKIDYYEFAGLLAPGTLVGIYLFCMFPELKLLIFSQNFTVGDFGIFFVLAFIVGHLTQALGNIFENVWWWFRGGMPTYWATKTSNKIVSKDQVTALNKEIREKLGLKLSVHISSLPEYEWFSITRQINSFVVENGNTTRIDVFNGNYGLNRGIAVSFLIISVSAFLKNGFQTIFGYLFLTCAVLSIYRMDRFARHYARELFVTFLALSNRSKKKGG